MRRRKREKTRETGALKIFGVLIVLGLFAVIVTLGILTFKTVNYAVNGRSFYPGYVGVPLMPDELSKKLNNTEISQDKIFLRYLVGESSSEDPGGDVTITKDNADDYRVQTKRFSDRFYILAPLYLALILTGIALWLVKQIVESAIAGDPFIPINVKRLRWIAVIALVGPFLIPTVLDSHLGSLTSRLDHYPSSGISYTMNVNFLAGLFILSIAEVFKRGTELRENEELTV